MAKKKKLRTLDLFAGVGGIRLGFENAGFETVFANDFDKSCKETYDLNFSEPKLNTEDIWKLDIDNLPEFDILLGGFPCQAFSIAGYRKGFRDEKGRGNLFFRIAEILEARKPRAFLLENVKNLKSHNGGKTFKIIKKTLENLGYHIKVEILNSMIHGNIPQNRERIFIVGFLDKRKRDNFEFPKPISLTKNFREFTAKKADKKYYYNDKPLYTKIKDDINAEDTVYQWRRKYVRANKKGVVPTLTANMGLGGHNVPIIKNSIGIRKLTPRECFLLQGFPADYKLPEIADSKLYHQAGNSVTVSVIERLAENMRKILLDEVPPRKDIITAYL
ncbi:MAG: DNA cytosine methyltransferase [Candidatus Micrarchaeia archaeon]|jgi:DNA (cytosine-5)-methyltransferase 1